ncbi:MAG TPA: class I SAM-dependent methyltransferase [Polyangiaceae bacterium]|nr:class I SAM-dependent methyltransferase [Polyangiaceae bacterium]
MALESLREIVSRLSASANALAALGAALDARASGVPLGAEIKPHVDEVVAALGVEGLDGATAVDLRPILGEIRAFTLTNAKLLFAASRGSGWRHQEPELLDAAGDVSAGFPHRLKSAIAANLEGLTDRFDSGAATFLDVGVGVAAMSIEMARTFPSLHIVGIDPWGIALASAREHVRAAGLDARIELREQAGEDLRDVDAFDLAWIPSIFMPEQAIPVVAQRVHRALRPGGWALVPSMTPSADPLAASLARLRTAMFGGFVTTPADVEAILRAQGFVEVRTLPPAPTALTALIVARRRVSPTIS